MILTKTIFYSFLAIVQQHTLDMIALEKRKDKEILDRQLTSRAAAASSSQGEEGGIIISNDCNDSSKSISQEKEIEVLLKDMERHSGERERLATEMALLSSRYNALEIENNKRITGDYPES